jgi:hypothetical protein
LLAPRAPKDDNMKYQQLIALAVGVALWQGAHADASYESTTQPTGGANKDIMKMAGMFSPSASSSMQKANSSIVAVKGNRMAQVSAKLTMVTDLDKETVTKIDSANKQYCVVTFEEERKYAEEQAAKMKQLMEEHKGDPAPALPPELTKNPPSFDAKAEDTGQTKTISGIDTHEVLLTETMKFQSPNSNDVLTYYWKNDVWLAKSDPPGWSEIQDFNKRMAAKMAAIGGAMAGSLAPLLASRPGLADGLKKLGEEMAKQHGLAIMTVQSLGGQAQGDSVAASSGSSGSSPLGGQGTSMTNEVVSGTASEAAQKEASQLNSSGNMGILSSSLLSSAVNVFQRHSQQLTQSATASASNAVSKPASGKPATVDQVLLETTIVLSNFSTESVPASAFEVPAGFTKVDWQEFGKKH